MSGKHRFRRVMITGGAGQLGRELDRLLSGLPLDRWCLDLPETDITSEAQVRARFAAIRPDLVVHAAARTRVEACETDRHAAMAVNAEATGRIAALCARSLVPMLYVSTDFVFDGRKGQPYEIDDRADPLNVYGLTKLEGERRVSAAGTQHWIVRTSWLYGVYGENFPKAILGIAARGDAPYVVSDQIGSPTSARDLAEVILRLAGVLPGETARPFGLYHCANSGSCSRWEFARAIVARSGWLSARPSVAPRPITSAELGGVALRPAYSVLSLRRLAMVGIITRHWLEGLHDFLVELRTLSPALFPAGARVAAAPGVPGVYMDGGVSGR